MTHIKNEQGFTLVTTLSIIVILAMSLPFLTLLMKETTYESDYAELSIQQFLLFLRDDLFTAQHYKVTSDELILDTFDYKKAHFVQMGNLVVRRVDGGYDVFLRDIDKIQFSEWSGGIKVVITSLEGRQYEKILRFYEG